MKNNLFSILQNKFLYILLFSVITFSACKKNDVLPIPTSGLMAFNLIPDSTGPIAFVLSNRSITNAPLSYTNYTGSYLSAYSGNRALGLYKANNSDSALVTTNFNFEPKKYYSAFAIGANGNYKNMIIEDLLDSLPTSTGNAFVRYINAIPDSSAPMVTIAANGTNVESGNASYGKVSDFTGIAPGNISVAVNNDSNISASRSFSVEKGKVYTILLLGMPNATDTAKKIQIKYIINGIVTP